MRLCPLVCICYFISAVSKHPGLSVKTQVERMKIDNGFVLINCSNDDWCYMFMLCELLSTYFQVLHKDVSSEWATSRNLIIITVLLCHCVERTVTTLSFQNCLISLKFQFVFKKPLLTVKTEIKGKKK